MLDAASAPSSQKRRLLCPEFQAYYPDSGTEDESWQRILAADQA